MATPYLKTLNDVVQSEHPPELDEVTFLLAALANQEDKFKAISSHLVAALLRHYASAASHPQCAAVRLVITRILENLVTIMSGREALFAADPPPCSQLLSMLRDAAPDVRRQACHLIATLSSFADAQAPLAHTRAVITALYHTFVNDIMDVAIDAIPAITLLCQLDYVTELPVVKKLVEILRTYVHVNDLTATRIIQSILTCLWNMAHDIARKEVVITAGGVPVIATLVDSQHDETRRLAMGALSAISISAAGKLAIIDIPAAIQTTCVQAIEKKTPDTIRTNSILTIRGVIEQPRGLHACARWLLHDGSVIDILGHAATGRAIAPLLDEPARIALGLDALSRLITDDRGRAAAWDILEIVPRLYTLQHTDITTPVMITPAHTPPVSSSSSSATAAATAAGVRSVVIPMVAKQCLDVICRHNSWAQIELDRINRLMASGSGAGSSSSSNAITSATVSAAIAAAATTAQTHAASPNVAVH